MTDTRSLQHDPIKKKESRVNVLSLILCRTPVHGRYSQIPLSNPYLSVMSYKRLCQVMPVRGPGGQFKSGFVAAKQQPNGMGCEDVWITRGMG